MQKEMRRRPFSFNEIFCCIRQLRLGPMLHLDTGCVKTRESILCDIRDLRQRE